MAKNRLSSKRQSASPEFPLSFFACPNRNCAHFNKFNAGNLSIAECMGKNKAIRRLYCKTCGRRFSEREGSLMAGTKLPEEDVVRIIKSLGYGCCIEATADICEVDPRTVERLLEKAGRRAEDFHRLQLEKLQQPIEAVQLDELHGRVAKQPKKGQNTKSQSIVRKAGAENANQLSNHHRICWLAWSRRFKTCPERSRGIPKADCSKFPLMPCLADSKISNAVFGD